ncbi:MAG: hypothetical protein AAAC49_00740, partial [Rhizobium leguminosarum]
ADQHHAELALWRARLEDFSIERRQRQRKLYDRIYYLRLVERAGYLPKKRPCSDWNIPAKDFFSILRNACSITRHSIESA